MISALLIAVPLAVIWVGITGHVSVESFIVGLMVGIVVQLFMGEGKPGISLRKLPMQLAYAVLFVFILLRDIVVSSVKLTVKVLSKDMDLQPGIITVPIQDPERDPLIAALSSYVIALTPGEFVVEVIDNTLLYVHCLDTRVSEVTAPDDQEKRLKMIYKITGR
jgi:multisubunit Na+/H+ antiporter MnhE subunit